ncbi:MAG: DUF2304 family protein [Elusimicrobia bacterium]|nr:DUF2304 family protein [Elusimicrobiota bacterium]
MVFQYILTMLIGMAVLRLIIQYYKKRINSFFFIFFFCIWSVVLFFNWNNEFLNRIGHLFGIDRGATVLVYFGLFLLFYFVFVSLVRFYIVEHDINKLVMKTAVHDFIRKYNLENID